MARTTIGKLLVKLLEPDEGRIQFRFPGNPATGGEESIVDAYNLSGRDMREFRRHAQMIFQDPYESMNPRRTVFDIISEPLSVQGIGNVMDRVDRVSEILGSVGLTPATDFLFRHPHELSGGQRQRVAIAPGARDPAAVRGGRRNPPPCWTFPAGPASCC